MRTEVVDRVRAKLRGMADVRPRRLPGGTRAVAALEFALVAPFLLTAALGLYDLANAALTMRRLTIAADAIAQIATAAAVNADNTNTLTREQAWAASTAPFALLPGLRAQPMGDYSVVLSAVVFRLADRSCTANCTYLAATAWSGTFQGIATQRQCGDLTAVADDLPPSPTTLPASAFGPASLLVVDMAYTFHPLFASVFTGDMRFTRSAYFPPRTGSFDKWVRYVSPPDQVVHCRGYDTGDS